MQTSRALLGYKTPPSLMRLGITKGWNTHHSIPPHIYSAHLKNYLKVYFTIKRWLDTQGVKLLSFKMTPEDTTTVVSMNIFWYKPVYKDVQSRRSKLFQPWTGWQSRWSRPPITLWRPRLVQNITNERKIIQQETVEEINAYSQLVQEQVDARRAEKQAAYEAEAEQQRLARKAAKAAPASTQ